MNPLTNPLEGALQWLEKEGFNLWYDEKTKLWTLINEDAEWDDDNSYIRSDADKMKLIADSFANLCH
jgi:hypothetical protein